MELQKESLGKIVSLIKIKGVEIGVLEGDTSKYLLTNNSHLILYLIDPLPKRKELIANIDEFQDRVKIIELKSDEAVKIFNKCELDFAWIDGDHSYEQVKRDIRNYLPLIKKGGIIGGHDYDSPAYPGVKQAVDEIFDITKIEKTVDFVWWVNV